MSTSPVSPVAEAGWIDSATNVSLPFEKFRTRSGMVERSLARRAGSVVHSPMGDWADAVSGPTSVDVAEKLWLRSTNAPETGSSRSALRAVDLFSGCGGLSIGLAEAARALGRSFQPLLAVDFDATATATYAANFPTAESLCGDILDVFGGSVGSRLTTEERMLSKRHSDVDVLVGGPPCQGHSDFNNRTRHRDGKNELYRTMVRAAEVLQPTHILIENVPGALNDRSSVVQRTAQDLSDQGYNVSLGVVDLSRIGVPQRRRRLILMASLTSTATADAIERNHARSMRSLRWAIDDLAAAQPGRTSGLVDEVARSAAETRRRIDYLFENDLYELPDEQRPACHAKGGHSYKAIYGRLSWERPSQTITTGFYSMCMGRYVHPSERRTLTAHEAARLQYIPDWFDFSAVSKRTALARMIGNAVPSRLSYAVALEWLR